MSVSGKRALLIRGSVKPILAQNRLSPKSVRSTAGVITQPLCMPVNNGKSIETDAKLKKDR